MHRAIQTLDVVEMICDSLQLIAGHMDILSFAQACRFFLDSGLNRLWRTQDNLLHFFRCMPEDLWEYDPDTGLRLCRTITPRDWERPLVYAHRIQNLTLTDYPSIQSLPRHTRWPFLHAHVIDEMAASCPRQHIFPMLQVILWDPHDGAMLPYIRILLGPQVHRVTLGVRAQTEGLSILPLLSRHLPAVRDVRVKWAFSACDSGQLHLVSSFVRELTSIRELDLDAIDLPSLLRLSQLRSLTSLSVKTDGLDVPTTTDLSSLFPPFAFPALCSLSLRDTPYHQASAYLLMFSGRPLSAVSISFRQSPPARHLCDIFTILADGYSHPALINLRFTCRAHSRSHGEDYDRQCFEVTDDALRQLSCFPNLTSVHIESRDGFALDDATAAELACAWPRIKALSLHSVLRAAPRLTLNALHSFARYCPELESLALTFNADDTFPLRDLAPFAQTALHRLDIGVSTLRVPDDVAALLGLMFPAVERVWIPFGTLAPELETQRAKWLEVNRRLCQARGFAVVDATCNDVSW